MKNYSDSTSAPASIESYGAPETFADQTEMLTEGLAQVAGFAELCRLHRSDLEDRATRLCAEASSMFRVAMTECCADADRAVDQRRGAR